MYLNSVLDAITRKGSKFTAEDLYKLNEAIFNLPEVDVVTPKTTSRLFQTLQNIVNTYNNGRVKKADPSFFYDYVALLATMQNQHFFNEKQNKTILGWLFDALREEVGPAQPPPAKGGKGGAPSAALTKEVARLEAENEALKKELEKLREVSDAIVLFQKYKPVAAEPKPRAKAEAKAKSKGGRKRSGKKEEEGGEGEAKAEAEAE